MTLPDRVRETIAAHQLLVRGARVIVAVSGGADSVALLHVLASLRAPMDLTLTIAHLDHGLRKESAEASGGGIVVLIRVGAHERLRSARL